MAVGRRERGARRLPQLAVIFLVRSKIALTRINQAQRLPRELLVHSGLPSTSPLCAVPTDVQTVDSLAAARAQAPIGVAVRDFVGSLCWPVRSGGRNLLLAPLHVLSPEAPLGANGLLPGLDVQGLDVDGALNGDHLARTLRGGGRLMPPPRESFDVQLAEPIDHKALKKMFVGLSLSSSRPSVREGAEVAAFSQDGSLRVLVPDQNGGGLVRGALPAHLVRHIATPTPILYRTDDGSERPVQTGLLELHLRFGNATEAGDSGAPVLGGPDGAATLVGMHIAGNPETGTSLVIPAWDLLNEGLYQGLPGASIQLGWS